MSHHENRTKRLVLLVALIGAVTSFVVLGWVRPWESGEQRQSQNSRRENRVGDQFFVPTLGTLILEGPELHASLRAKPHDAIRHLPPGLVLPSNPHLSSDDKFVAAVARSGSQGRLDREGIQSALYGFYSSGSIDLGIYGLEAMSDADADEREKALRDIWGKNTSLNRARIHRQARVLLVVWHDGVSDECWDSVNASLLERLTHSSRP